MIFIIGAPPGAICPWCNMRFIYVITGTYLYGARQPSAWLHLKVMCYAQVNNITLRAYILKDFSACIILLTGAIAAFL